MKNRNLQTKRMIRTFLLVLLFGMAGLTKSYAYDFSAVCETGQTLYYNIINAEYHYVELTYPNNLGNSSAWSGYERPSGNIILPKYVYDANNDLYFVTSIGNDAFNTCINLISVTISDFVTSIGSSAFDCCTRLMGELNIPNSVTTINDYAFNCCYGLTSVTVGNSVTSIGSHVFSNCSSLEQIVVNAQNTIYDSRDNCNAIIHTSTNELVVGCRNTVIPNSVVVIGESAFVGCKGNASELNIPNSVTTISENAFSYCTCFTGSLTIPNSVTSIGSHAFAGCSGLNSIVIGNSVTSIGINPFLNCSGLEQVAVESENMVFDSRDNCNAIIETNTNTIITGCRNSVIPNSVSTIGWDAFMGCSGLTGNLTIPNSVITIRNRAYLDCSGLTSVIIGNSVTTLGGAAFGCCSGLTSVAFGNSVVTIGGSAFGDCSGLTGELIIPNSVTWIGDYAFYGCNGLSSVSLLASTPPTMENSNAFSNTSNTLKIYVPYESLDDYQTATNWSDYVSQIQPMAYKTIPAHGESGGWAFIASPLLANTNPTEIDDMIAETESNYDLYRFNQGAELEWENWKSHANNDDHYHFNLKNGQGYLYANAEDVNLIFKGTLNEGTTKTINLIYEAGAPLAGWNLVGNPFPMAATVTGSSYYVMNENGTALNPIPVSSGGTIPACEGIMVQAAVLGQPITFTRESQQVSNNNGTLQIAVAQTNTRSTSTGSVTALDKVVVSFNEGDELGKFVFNKDNAKLYIPQGDEEYAIACAEKQGEMPLNFEAKESGSYTISVNPKSVEMDYLHLIDNMTGTDVDLLATPSYTFESKTSDYASRFRLVFSANGNTDNENEEPFAFISNGNIIVAGDYANATLQIVDMLGHVVVSKDVAYNVSTNGIASGVYVLRLINGNDVKTQKIVVR